VYVGRLSLHDFRSYREVEVELGAGATTLVGRNGQGKTNLVEAVDYLARLSSHRVASDAPLVRAGTEQAVVRAEVHRDGRQALIEVQITPGRSNRARVNRSPLPRSRDVLGMVRTVLFSPDDLAMVKGEPGERRRFLDDLLVQRAPRFAGIRSDYERVLRQRSSLLKTARVRPDRGKPSGVARIPHAGGSGSDGVLSTLGVWDSHLARVGAELMTARMELVSALRPFVTAAYTAVSDRPSGDGAGLTYKPSLELSELDHPDRTEVTSALMAEIERRREEELARGVCLVGPHRDDLTLALGPLPAKGYASHGESWSLALALRLAGYDLLRADGDDPVLILDDVFAELDTDRRHRLAELVGGAEQVLVTAAVPDDVPAALKSRRLDVADGKVIDHVG
jgi:DNA replication and repair protein RecF